MRLIKCYIENFGTLHQFEYEFNGELNVIMHQNGWGKTTFAAFLKAMFYGLEQTTKQKIEENERKKYRPWNGQIYGGYLDFETKGKRYRIQRYFGMKDKEDEFVLYDLSTKLVSTDYKDKIGEELFHIDREAFERSIYILSSQIKVVSNDSLSAKLTNVMHQENDMNQFEHAKRVLEDSIRAYQKKGDKGKINDLQGDIQLIKRQIADIDATQIIYKELKQKEEALSEKKDEINKELSLLESDTKKISEMEKKKIQWDYKERLEKEILEKEEKITFLEDFFQNGIPEEDIIFEFEKITAQLAGLEEDILKDRPDEHMTERFTQLEYYFHNDRFHESQLVDLINEVNFVKEQNYHGTFYNLTEKDRTDLDELKKMFENKTITSADFEEIKQLYKKFQDLKTEYEIENNRIKSLETEIISLKLRTQNGEEEKKKAKKISLMSVISIFLGIILLFNKHPLAGGLIFALGLMVTMFMRSKLGKNLFEIDREICQNNEDHLAKIKMTVDGIMEKRTGIQKRIREFLSEYMEVDTINEQDLYDHILQVKNQFFRYEELLEKQKIDADMEAAYKNDVMKNHKELQNKFLYFDGIADMDEDEFTHEKCIAYVSQIRESFREYEELKHRMEKLKENERVYREKENLILGFTSKYTEDAEKSHKEILKSIKRNLDDLIRLETEFDEANERLKKYIEENNLDDSKEMEIEMSFDDLTTKRKSLLEQLEFIQKEINQIRIGIREIEENMAKKTELEQEGERLSKELEDSKAVCRRLQLTKEYLEKAKDEFSGKYIGGINGGLKKYCGLIEQFGQGEMESVEAQLDAKLELTIQAKGKRMSMEYLSTGIKDLLGICTRFALCEELFKNEKPFMILDDPFVNFDKEKVNGAMKILHELSKQHQIVYFTCHPSRGVGEIVNDL